VGSRGPIPRRKESLRGHRAKAEIDAVTSAPSGVATDCQMSVPKENKHWNATARRLWRAAKVSGQARFYEATDWAMLYWYMDLITELMNSPKRTAGKIQVIQAGLSDLLFTEGDRRRAGLELSRPSSQELQSAGVEELDKWRKTLAGQERLINNT